MENNDLFVIAAGGTGAKVIEALVHLCAAGLGPKNVHVLLVDGDAANGNRKRAVETWNAYKKLQSWPWEVKPKIGVNKAAGSLFASKIEVYALSEQFSTAEQGSLRPLVEGDAALHEALGVVLDDQELDMNMRVGFTGRPNLGCLVMDHYLRRHLGSHDRARLFIQALEDSAREREDSQAADCKAGSHNPRIVVVGSVFGGTGASLLPVAKPCIEAEFVKNDAHGNSRNPLFKKMLWGKVMLLPYFRPEGGVNLGIVNPARYRVDTSGALWFYGLERDVEPTYLIGSDNPETRRIRAVGGEIGQNNPSFYHELLAALAILDFYHSPTVVDHHPIRHFSEVAQAGTIPESNALGQLPALVRQTQEILKRQFATLFHLAAFSLDWLDSPGAKSNSKPEFHKGLFQYAKESKLTGWEDAVHKKLAQDRDVLKQKDKPCSDLLYYFARYLFWSRTVFCHQGYGASGLSFNEDRGQYASLHNTLNYVAGDEIKSPDNHRDDNVAAHICRLALAGLAREEASKEKENYREHDLELARNPLLDEKGLMIRLGMAFNSLPSALAGHGFDESEIKGLAAEFEPAKLANSR